MTKIRIIYRASTGSYISYNFLQYYIPIKKSFLLFSCILVQISYIFSLHSFVNEMVIFVYMCNCYVRSLLIVNLVFMRQLLNPKPQDSIVLSKVQRWWNNQNWNTLNTKGGFAKIHLMKAGLPELFQEMFPCPNVSALS